MRKNVISTGFLCILLIFTTSMIWASGQEEIEFLFSIEEIETSLPRPVAQALKSGRTERNAMVRDQIFLRDVKTERVLKALLATPRHIFVPEEFQDLAYFDRPLPIGYGQTISQPYIVALMTEALDIRPGDRVLEIGTGSGYQSAVLSLLTPHVYTIEIVDELYTRTSQIYEDYGYINIKTKQGDGYFGWEEFAPFDAIIVTAAAGHIPPPLLAQLKPGGRIVIPVGSIYDVQLLILVYKWSDGKYSTEQLSAVRFVPMTGSILEK